MRKKKQITTLMVSYGAEPEWNMNHTMSNLAMFLNWYSSTKDAKDAKKFLVAYLKKNHKDDPKFIKFVEDYKEQNLHRSICWLTRIITQSELAREYLGEKVNSYLEELRAEKRKEDSLKQEVKLSKPKINKSLPESDITISILEYRLDAILSQKSITHFSMSDYIAEFPHTKEELLSLKTYINNQIEEWNLSTIDDEFKEAYDFLTLSFRKEVREYHKGLLRDIEEILSEGVLTKTRKVRKKKVKSPAALVKKLKFLKEDNYLELKSVNPEKIIGSSGCLFYDTKRRNLGLYYALDKKGITVKGTTLQNVDLDKSFSKKLRENKVEASFFHQIVSSPITHAESEIGSIRAVKKPLTGRINGDILLLKVY